MQSFTVLQSQVVSLLVPNIDTDQIIPARFLTTISKAGLGRHLFEDWRYAPDGSARADFPLNRPQAVGAQVLLAGDNFGCGSSREHAPWALMDYGFRAVISTSFADIFRNNALKNGLLPVQLDSDIHAWLADLSAAGGLEVVIDLAGQTLSFPGGHAGFPIDAYSKTCLLEGLDDLGFLLKYTGQITAYEQAQPNGFGKE